MTKYFRNILSMYVTLTKDHRLTSVFASTSVLQWNKIYYVISQCFSVIVVFGGLTDIYPCMHACSYVLSQYVCVCVCSGEVDWGTCVLEQCLCVLVYAPGRTYAGVDCGAGVEVRGAAGVCQVRGLQLLIAGWYTDTDRGIWGTASPHSPGCEWWSLPGAL